MSNNKYNMSNDSLIKLLDALKKQANLLAPQTDEYGDTYFKTVADAKKVIFKPFKPLMPAAREVLFGQIEEMIKFKKSGNSTKLESVDASAETIIFGLPCCDIDAILYTDEFFGKREFADFYYANARAKLTLISLVCTTPPNESCFCASMGHGPVAKKGYDLQLTDLGDGSFFVQVGSQKGEKIVADNKALFSAGDAAKWEAIVKKAEGLPVDKKVNKDKAINKMKKNPLDEKMIQEITERCITCGGCNYACPTCTCFNVTDQQKDDAGVRTRILDSCILSGYFRMAGGHNPKAKKEERTRNRYLCKLLWDQEKFGDSGCVGCGRCLDACPVKIDIKEILKA